jgi:polyvinyl alcohol dehydrogenase (cytochrome)
MKALRWLVAAALMSSCVANAARAAEEPDGETLFYERCASCHVDTDTATDSAQGATTDNRARSVAAMSKMSRKAVRSALVTGPMWIMGAALTLDQQEAVIKFLVPTDNAGPDLAKNNMCTGAVPPVVISDKMGWNGFGNGYTNERYQKDTSINAANVAKLKLKWAFGIPDTGSAFGQPTIAGDRLYFGSGDGAVYALNRQTGCTIWAYRADTIVRSPVYLAKVGGRDLAFFGDAAGYVYAVDAASGAQVWKVRPEAHPTAKITAAPQAYKDRVYIGITGGEDIAASFPGYVCCTFRGVMVALDAKTGAQIWKTYTIPEEPRFIKKDKTGKDIFAPGGAGIWTAATIDPKRNALYVGTSDCHTVPVATTCDSIMAFDLDSGKINWHFEATKNDAFNLSCGRESVSETCSELRQDKLMEFDLDFGQPPILKTVADGRELLVVGQKSGDVWAFDPNAKGKVVWKTKIGRGGPAGGIKWGSAADDENIYVSNVRTLLDDSGKELGTTGVTAVRMTDGKVVWRALSPKPACTGTPGCSASLDAAVTLIPGVLFSGSKDGHMRAYDAKTGAMIWDFDTMKEFPTVNGVKAQGGSFGGVQGPTVVGNTLYIAAGYGSLSGMEGNALLAFELPR